MIIDTHSHLQFPDFQNDIDEVVKRTRAQGMSCINVGTDYKSSQAGVEFAKKHGEGFYAAIGLHPTDVDEDFNVDQYRELAKSESVVAVGEIGLDYFRQPFDAQKQKQLFAQQLDLAKDLQLPAIIHCRAAHEDVITTLQHYNNMAGVIHCFTGTLEQAKKYVELGFLLGIGGIIFKFNIDQVIKNIPLEHLLLETDCPYLTPAPEGKKRNEPLFIKHTIQKIAELKNISIEEVEKTTTQNARELFGLDKVI